jgi:hypothetical protein
MQRNLDHIELFQKLARRDKFQLLFVMIPSKQEVRGTDPDTEVEQDFVHVSQIEAFLRMHHIDYIDPTEDFRKAHTQIYWTFDGHLNPAGNELLGLVVAQHLAEASGSSTLQTQINGMLAKVLQ